MSIVQKIKDIEDELARTQKNKATMHHIGLLKAKLAKLRKELIEPKGAGGGGAGVGFDVAKTGVASIGFIGFPSVGKSTLMSKLTGTHSEVGAYEFTTLTTVPGVIQYKGAKIQILDLPGIIEGAKDGKGRGRQVIAVARTCSLIFMVLDVMKPLNHKKILEHELEGFGLRLNKKPPNITFKKKDKGGISITTTVPGGLTHLDNDSIKAILSEYKIHNADIAFRCDATEDDLIDIISDIKPVYVPCIYVLNKIDQISIEELDILSKIPNCVPISSHHEWNFDDLLQTMWDKLELARIYTKPKGQLPDYSAPVVLRNGKNSVEDFCMAIHKSIIKQFKYANVWGYSAKHQPQKVGKDHMLNDEDVVQIMNNNSIPNSSNSSQISLNTRQELRKAKSRLRDFYGLSVATTPAINDATPSTTSNNNDLNDKNFNLDKYLTTVFHDKSILELAKLHSDLSTDIRTLDGDMKTLVYENYEKFISATDTIKNIKTRMESMEVELGKLDEKISTISTFMAATTTI